MLSITTLKPRQIVWGKLLSAMVQIFIYYSAITPFMAFAILLKGIDVPTIAVVLAASLFWSLALSMIALTVSTFGSQRYWQVFLTLAVLGGLAEFEHHLIVARTSKAASARVPHSQMLGCGCERGAQ